MRRQLCGAVLVCLALFATAQGQQPQAPAGSRFMPAEIIVKFRNATPASQRDAIINSRAAGVIRRFNALGLHRVRLRNGQSVESALAAFRALPDVALAQPNYIRRAFQAVDPDDPFWQIGFQWALPQIQAPEVWDSFTTGSPDVVIASIDTGVDYLHPDLAANIWHNPGEIPANGLDDDNNGYVDDVHGIDTVNGDTDPMDDHSHGTQTAGIMAMVGNNGVAGVGVTWNSKVLTCKFVDQTGSGTDADAIECFDYLVTMKQRGVNIRVSNNSWGSLREDPPALALKDAIDAAGAAGILNVFAAGNDGTDNDILPFDPASFASPSVISVAASDDADGRASFSNFGATSVHLAAPGVFIFTLGPGSIGFADGTSMAAPMVSGSAALMVANDPSLTVDQLKARLITSVDVLPQWGGVVSSGGRLNVLNAIESGGNARPTVALTNPTAGSTFVAPASIALEAAATDSDGTVAKVDFYANGTLVGTDTTSPYETTWSTVQVGTHTLTAEATDDLGAARMSIPVTITVTTPTWRVNVALPANGGTVAASSTYDSSFPASAANNGDRKGLGWGSGGNWNDATGNTWPDWLEVSFNGAQTIEEIDVFTMQDNYQAPSEPTASMMFSQYGIRDFEVQYWTGTAWQAVPNGVVTANTLVWRRFNFAAITTTKIRVLVTNGLSSHSRLTEVEAYTGPAGVNNPPMVALTNPANGSVFPASATVPLEASASDAGGSVAKVDFYANGTLVGSDPTSPYAVTWSNVPVGTHTLTAEATDNLGATRTSSVVTITVTAPPGRVNVALAANGGTVAASSTYSASYPASAVTNGDRKGLGWGSGGNWNDATGNTWPDWLEVSFNGAQTIDEIDVFTMQDNYQAPSEPTPSMTFSQYGVRDFEVQYWTGTAWQAVPNGVVTANTLVWRRFNFAAITTSKIRVLITNGLASHSRLIEVEAYTGPGGVNDPPEVTLTSPGNGSVFPASANVPLEAAATDSDGTVAKVDFYANGTLVGTDTTSPYAVTWSNVPVGTHTLTAEATDNLGAVISSSPISVSVTVPPWRVNVALPANGGTVAASSTYSSSYPASAVNNGDRKGLGWGSGGNWNDATGNAWPDWLEVSFNGAQAIEEIDVFTMQDNYQAPSEPTASMMFSQYGVRDFEVQYWTGTTWQAVPNGVVTANTLVWRRFNFASITTSKIRVLVTNGLSSHSRLTEVEAYTGPAGVNNPPTVALTNPANGSVFPASATVPLEASASDPGGSVAKVDFYANGTLVGSDPTSPFSVPWTSVAPGSYSVTAVATDNLGATRTSNAVTITVSAPPNRVNVALAANGGTVAASSTYSASYPASAVNNGDRRGLGWGSGGNWNDATGNTWPDWLEVSFNGAQTIDEIDVFTMQDNYQSPSEPTPSMTFSQYGIRDFEVQYWTGTAWQAVPNGVVTANTLVWRRFNFAAITTSKIRVLITNGLNSHSRLTEVEAWTASETVPLVTQSQTERYWFVVTGRPGKAGRWMDDSPADALIFADDREALRRFDSTPRSPAVPQRNAEIESRARRSRSG